MYPMPAQRQPPVADDPSPWRPYVKFSDPDADDYIVRDIFPGDARRWTSDHPEMKFRLQPRPGMRFSMNFTIVGATFRDTGPVTVTIRVNNRQLGVVRCDHPADYHFEQPVPIAWLGSGDPVKVLAEANPLWTAPSDGAHLGYLIVEAGFR